MKKVIFFSIFLFVLNYYFIHLFAKYAVKHTRCIIKQGLNHMRNILTGILFIILLEYTGRSENVV